MTKLTRRNFIRGVGVGAVVLGGLGGYTRWGEPRWLQIDHHQISLSPATTAARSVRVLHLSDLHLSPVVSLEFLAQAVTLGLAQRPDLILLTGDFFTKTLSEAAAYIEVLRRLSLAAPTFSCLGNHDGGAWAQTVGGYATTATVEALLAEARIVCLENEGQEIFVNGRRCQIIGVGDLWSGRCQPQLGFGRTPPRGQATRLLLNHNPDAKDQLKAFDWDLMLCGHTHGGQLRLPLLGTPFAPVSDKRYVSGLHEWERRWIYITHGVGNLHGVRFNCRPQVSVLDLV